MHILQLIFLSRQLFSLPLFRSVWFVAGSANSDSTDLGQTKALESSKQEKLDNKEKVGIYRQRKKENRPSNTDRSQRVPLSADNRVRVQSNKQEAR